MIRASSALNKGEKGQNLLTINLGGDTTKRKTFSSTIHTEGRLSSLAHTMPRPAEHSLSLRISSLVCLGTLPGIHPLHDNLILLALHHVVGEHGVEIRDRSCQHDPVSTEFMVPYLKREKGKEGRSAPSTTNCTVQMIHCSMALPAQQ